ncbi:hypothetical protein [Salinibacter ruber]|nr:hypothetical protein [Salinibacter ruber]
MVSPMQDLLTLPFPANPPKNETPAERPALPADVDVTPAVYAHINLSMKQLDDALRIVPGEEASLDDMRDISDVARPPAKTQRDVDKVFAALEGRIEGLLEQEDAIALFALLTPPLRAKMLRRSSRDKPPNLFVFESFNRHDDEGNFNHLSWKLTGRYSL